MPSCPSAGGFWCPAPQETMQQLGYSSVLGKLGCPSSEDTATSWRWRLLHVVTQQSHHHMAAELWVQLVPRRHWRMGACATKCLTATSAWGIWSSLLHLRMGTRNFTGSNKPMLFWQCAFYTSSDPSHGTQRVPWSSSAGAGEGPAHCDLSGKRLDREGWGGERGDTCSQRDHQMTHQTSRTALHGGLGAPAP